MQAEQEKKLLRRYLQALMVYIRQISNTVLLSLFQATKRKYFRESSFVQLAKTFFGSATQVMLKLTFLKEMLVLQSLQHYLCGTTHFLFSKTKKR
jgi:hypothetical protein